MTEISHDLVNRDGEVGALAKTKGVTLISDSGLF
ncbi:MAG: hypothetical protein ACI86X_001294 [Moritella sp.]|jgi:hypothetical protein